MLLSAAPHSPFPGHSRLARLPIAITADQPVCVELLYVTSLPDYLLLYLLCLAALTCCSGETRNLQRTNTILASRP